jgi:hypothetical protein
MELDLRHRQLSFWNRNGSQELDLYYSNVLLLLIVVHMFDYPEKMFQQWSFTIFSTPNKYHFTFFWVASSDDTSHILICTLLPEQWQELL